MLLSPTDTQISLKSQIMSALSGSRQMTKSTILFFISLIPHLDETLSKQLTNPGLLGFFAKFVKAEKQWLDDFKKHITEWANNNSWSEVTIQQRISFLW